MVDPAAVDDVDGRPHGARLLGARRPRRSAATAPARRGTPARPPSTTRTIVAALLDGAAPVDDDDRAAHQAVQRHADQLPVPPLLRHPRRRTATPARTRCADGRVLLVRDYYQLADSDFWWSDVAADVPYHNLTAALVLDGVRIDRITDFGTTNTDARGLPRPPRRLRPVHHRRPAAGRLRPVPPTSIDAIVAAVRTAQSAHTATSRPWTATRRSAAAPTCTSRFLRPFAEEAGVADELDWTVPRDIPGPLYELVSAMEGDNAGVADDGPYYAPLA